MGAYVTNQENGHSCVTDSSSISDGMVVAFNNVVKSFPVGDGKATVVSGHHFPVGCRREGPYGSVCVRVWRMSKAYSIPS